MKFFTTQMYLERVLGDTINDCIICCEMAADLTGECKRSVFTPITIYVLEYNPNLPNEVEQFIVNSFDEYDWTYFNDTKIRVTTPNQTIIDLFRRDRDLSVILECIGTYYYDHNKSLSELVIPEDILDEFNKWKEEGIHYYDDA